MGDDFARQRQLDTSSLRIGTGDAAQQHHSGPSNRHSAPGRPSGTDHSARPRRKKTGASLTAEPMTPTGVSPRTAAESARLYESTPELPSYGTDHSARPRRKKTGPLHVAPLAPMSWAGALPPLPSTAAATDHNRLYGSAGELPFRIEGGRASASASAASYPHTSSSTTLSPPTSSEEPRTPGGTPLCRDPNRPRRKKTGVIYGYITTTAADAPILPLPVRAGPQHTGHGGGGGAGGGGGRGGDGAKDLLAASMFTMQVADLAQEATDVYGGAGAGGGAAAAVVAVAGTGGRGGGVPDVVTRQPVRPAAAGERRLSSTPREHILTQTDI